MCYLFVLFVLGTHSVICKGTLVNPDESEYTNYFKAIVIFYFLANQLYQIQISYLAHILKLVEAGRIKEANLRWQLEVCDERAHKKENIVAAHKVFHAIVLWRKIYHLNLEEKVKIKVPQVR